MQIEAKDLVKVYGELVAVAVENLVIENGQSFGLVGNNGAGKTTFLRLVLDLIRPNRGEVRIDGESVDGENWKANTGSYLDRGFLIDFLTPEEYFYFVGSTFGMVKEDVDAQVEKHRWFFTEKVLGTGKYIRDLSQGNAKKVGIIAALLPDPDLIILDEPFANLDPTSQIQLKQILNSLNDERGITMIVSSHDLNHVTEVCDRIALLEGGHIIRDIPTNDETLRELEDYFTIQRAAPEAE